MTKKFSIKKLVAGALAAAMVVTALPVSGLSVKAADEVAGTVKVYRSYNPNDGEHLYTVDLAEHNSLVAAGRSDEGVKFITPAKSNTPVYRVYNPNSGEHLLVSKGEAEGLAAIGWSNEDIKMYSDDKKGVPIYRVYNPNAKDAGAHLYTASKEEATYLVSLGWSWDNNGEPMLYGVNEEVKQDLALDKVEDASGGRGNVVIAYFNKPVGDLQPTDIQIRRVSDDELFSIEKVTMSSDKKTATLTLVNTNAAGAAAAVLAPNVDYNMIVTTGGETAEKVFFIPNTAVDVTVFGADVKNRVIYAEDWTDDMNEAGPGETISTMAAYNVPEDMTVDYAALLGSTVTIKHDKTNKVLSINQKSGEKTIYSAFKEVADTAGTLHLQDIATEKSYSIQGNGSAALPASIRYMYGDSKVYNYGHSGAAYDGNRMAPNTEYEYGKLVLNDNGKIKAFVALSKWSGNIYVSKVSGNSIFSKTNQEQTLENYAIVKDGKSITINDIKADDVVFYNTSAKLAVVYNNVKTGKIEQVYDNAGFRFGGKDYDGSKASYINKGSLAAVDTKYLKSLGTEKDVTVILNHANTPVYVLGEQSEIATSSVNLVLTKKGDGYSQVTSNYVRLVGFNGVSEVTEDIDIGKIESLTVYTAINAKKTYKSSNGEFTATETTGDTASDYGTAKTGEGLAFVGIDSTGAAATLAADRVVLSTDLFVGKMVSLTKDSKGVVTEITIPWTNDIVSGTNVFDGDNDKDFKAGYKAIDAFTVAGTTPVFTVSDGPKVSMTTYASFDKTIALANVGCIDYYLADAGNIGAIVIDNQDDAAFSDDSDGSTTAEYVVKDVKYLDNKISSLTVIKAGAEKTFTKFGESDSLKTEVSKGDVINVKVLKDGVTVSTVDTATIPQGNVEDRIYGVSTSAPGSFYVQESRAGREHLNKLTLTADATIVKIENDAVSAITISDLKSLSLTKSVSVSLQTAGGDKVDAVVVDADNDATQTLKDTLDDLAVGRGGTGYTGYAATVTSVVEYNAMKEAKRDLEVVRDDMASALTSDGFKDGDDDGDTDADGTTGWGTSTDASANGNTIYGTLSDELTRAAKYQIVGIKAMTGTAQTATNAPFGSDDDAEAAAKAALPTSIHCTMADGSEKDIKVGFGTVTAGTGDDAVCIANDNAADTEATLNWVYTTAAGLPVTTGARAFVVTPKAGTGTGAPTYVISAGAVANSVTLQ